jgi:hypothetical protein
MQRACQLLLVATFLSAACSSNKVESRGPGISRDTITAEEIEASRTSSSANAYDVIKKLRGNFLSYRGRTSLQGTSSPDPFVYLDDQAYGPISSLRQIPASQIETIRLYRLWEAQMKYGQGLMGGVIAVATKQ